MLAPIHISWCIAYWTRANPADDLGIDHFESEAGREVFAWMIREKLIVWTPEEKRHVPQERLGVFIEHLCAQPLPVQKWVMPEQGQ